MPDAPAAKLTPPIANNASIQSERMKIRKDFIYDSTAKKAALSLLARSRRRETVCWRFSPGDTEQFTHVSALAGKFCLHQGMREHEGLTAGLVRVKVLAVKNKII